MLIKKHAIDSVKNLKNRLFQMRKSISFLIKKGKDQNNIHRAVEANLLVLGTNIANIQYSKTLGAPHVTAR